MSLIRGVLLAGKFRTQHELNGMSHDDQRNTLIVELSERTNQSVPHFQSLDDATLAGTGAVLVFLREARIRTDAELKTISDDDQRNILIVELDSQTHLGPRLQGFSNMDLVLGGLGDEDSGISLHQPTFIRGVLLAGKFRTQHELNNMSNEDQRNTLIVELTAHSNQSNYQSFDDYALAGMGAVLIFLRESKIRDDSTLKTMSADDQRNTLIVEIDAQTKLGSRLQGLTNIDLVRVGLGIAPEVVFKPLPPPLQPLPADSPMVFTSSIVTGGLAALGGWMTVTINLDGSVRWQGHAHDSGADGYDFGITALIRPPSGPAIALAHTGSVGGTFTSGSRDHDWDETSPPRVDISSSLSAYNGASFETHLEYDSDIGSAFESIVSWIVKFGIGSVLTSVGVVIFVGVEIGSLISTGSLVPGARVLEGVLWMAGPGNTLLAIVAEGIASLGSRTREITQEEYDWANNEVFLGSLPPRDRLVLTDTIGGGNRAFTFPRYDGKITLNMGEAAFDDPRNFEVSDRLKYGQIFIHELVHTCQIYHTKVDLALLADAFASKVCEATGTNPYLYGVAGFDYTNLNLEQQAQVVSDWFAGFAQRGDDTTNHTGMPKDPNSPYFRYVNENLRTGNL